jgi:hypothetical protein
MSEVASSRVPVNLCPYCGEEDIRPVEGDGERWACRACLRLFSVTFHGMKRDAPPVPPNMETPS